MALVLALVALVLAWVAFNRTGQDVEALVEQEVQEAIEEIEQAQQDAEEAVENATGTEATEETTNADQNATTNEGASN